MIILIRFFLFLEMSDEFQLLHSIDQVKKSYKLAYIKVDLVKDFALQNQINPFLLLFY